MLWYRALSVEDACGWMAAVACATTPLLLRGRHVSNGESMIAPFCMCEKGFTYAYSTVFMPTTLHRYPRLRTRPSLSSKSPAHDYPAADGRRTHRPAAGAPALRQLTFRTDDRPPKRLQTIQHPLSALTFHLHKECPRHPPVSSHSLNITSLLCHRGMNRRSEIMQPNSILPAGPLLTQSDLRPRTPTRSKQPQLNSTPRVPSSFVTWRLQETKQKRRKQERIQSSNNSGHASPR
ncbi:uncharacterized protein M437DRAFT_65703 [Aureobasidium melanogenum CBS 110374]|uniref:Uncharacterized protein n=1 Tax=Aureobasidium melanogenum (strain CBS 110374) TaxID=1043003 RepID=A0A074VRN6_AURM1|nr:uncharacterized protein M437DRAFT_65703 [Aureobasidium melanogenum CBS 110374]KEQ63098.1 hypothetical protein M437DRAFT_65703 [Aureobasidium melanogenum CBS 110374]